MPSEQKAHQRENLHSHSQSSVVAICWVKATVLYVWGLCLTGL